MSTELAPPEGRCIAGRYQLRSVIGRGGAGTVWRADDVLLRREVAVKELHLPATLTEDERRVLRERVLREARSAAAVRHPVLVTVFDVVEDGDRPWIVLELVEAQTLAALVHERTLEPAEAARIGIDLLAALQAVHRAGIQHRDVKPGNVLIEADGRPRLTDFGIASTAGDSSLTSTGVLLGSPSYLPPERARGGAGGPESDLWGLAATLYSAVEGCPPYNGSHPLAVLTAVVEGRRRPAERAGDLEPLLADLLDRDPEDRPAADEVRNRLVAVAGPGLGALVIDPHRKPGIAVGGRDVTSRTDALSGTGSLSGTTRDSGTEALPDADTLVPPDPAAGRDPLRGSAREPAGPALDSTAALQLTPPARRPNTRRRLLVGAAALLVLLLVVGAVVALSRGAGSPATSPVPSQNPSTAQNGPVRLAPAALDATAATAPTPPGWVRYTDPSGWSVAHPADWRRTQLGERGVDFVQPGTGAYLHIETSSTAPTSVSADWDAQEKLLATRVSTFARVGKTPADGGTGERAADWEFTFDLAGSPLHAIDRGLSVDGTGYTLYWQTPAAGWPSSLPTLSGLFASFATR